MDFGDGGTSTEQSPSHTYSTAGDYTVKLIASGAVNTDSTLQILHLLNQPTVAGFTYSFSGSNPPLTVNFSNTSTNATGWRGILATALLPQLRIHLIPIQVPEIIPLN
jgi:PKD repeat protein